MRRRLARWGRLLAASLLALIAAITIAAGIYVWVTPGGESIHALYRGPFVRVDGRELAYRQWGTHGSPIVLIGGFIEGTDVWRHTAPLLARTHRVYAVDLPPFGYSERKGPYVLATWIDEVEGFEHAAHHATNARRPLLGAAVVVGEALRRPMTCGASCSSTEMHCAAAALPAGFRRSSSIRTTRRSSGSSPPPTGSFTRS